MTNSSVQKLIGRTIAAIEISEDRDEVKIAMSDGDQYKMYHEQVCCERVSVEDVVGDLEDLIGSPILQAEEVTSEGNHEGESKEDQDSFTWTFYKFATIKGSVTIRWYGESNGYYSESVEFVKTQEAAQPTTEGQPSHNKE